jgi:hypothetical protein
MNEIKIIGCLIYLIVGFIFLTAYITFLVLLFNNSKLPVWACHKLGWHLAPTKQGFDGCSINGKCPRCNKPVMQDSWGGWF